MLRRHSPVPVLAAALLILGPMTADATVTDLFQNDAHTGTDAGDHFHTPTELRNPDAPWMANGNYTGDLYPGDDPQDWYAFPARAGTVITLSFEVSSPACDTVPSGIGGQPANLSYTARLYDPDGVAQGPGLVISGLCGTADPVNVTADRGGWWRIRVAYGGVLGQDPMDLVRETRSSVHASTSAANHQTPPPPPVQTGHEDDGYSLHLWCEPMCEGQF